MVNGIGGYSGVSGASTDTDEPAFDYTMEDDDEVIQRKYFHDQPERNTDGDKWLKYEESGVGYVLIVDGDGNPQTILAEDRDGNRLYDYPIPDIDNLTFDIDLIAKSATDNLHRNYTVRTEK